ncbi:50S ribosomal protein L23 [Candidatus Mycoplasma haematobovis]|uniref:50S ribosomal protein L23 n=1 Tax=Candidatus Mycoplasma haematobovis TaxID=432608 RepID=A0A1A9QEI6_9MOLU|nr:50S ribosomal protein L23 [Candidatus Mycoplasma haematobovis]OAL10366.1 50S ribosomal protein L23 [Candidatus Mycoplasma haematobovis]
MEITSIIIKPKITEKTQNLKSLANPKLTFFVNRRATKHQVALAFKTMFGVEPKAVNIINNKPAKARYMLKSKHNFTKANKTAYITVSGEDFSGFQEKLEPEAKVEAPATEE